jgi:hypothetical protein
MLCRSAYRVPAHRDKAGKARSHQPSPSIISGDIQDGRRRQSANTHIYISERHSMPTLDFTQGSATHASAAHTDVLGLAGTGILHHGPIIGGMPWPELLTDVSGLHSAVLDLAHDLFPGPLTNGTPAEVIVHQFSPLG